jgi:hypothetical protein
MPRGAALTPEALYQRAAAAQQQQVRINRGGNVIVIQQQVFWPQQWGGGGVGGGWDPGMEPNVPPMTRQQELDEMVRAKIKISAELRDWSPADPKATVPDQLMVQGNFNERLKMVRLFDKQVRALRAEAQERGEPLAETPVVTPEPEMNPEQPDLVEPEQK